MNVNTDAHFMSSAIDMAKRGLGKTAENPSVGCVIVNSEGIILSRSRTADDGRPHAETLALRNIGSSQKNLTMYVTLEPCAHYGQTPPCAEVIASDKKISRVVIGALDPDPRVSGRGIEILKNAGIEVTMGVLKEECRKLHRAFITRIEKNRPFITLKSAVSTDGKTALQNGDSHWITGEVARRHVHLLRAQHDAVLVGVNTLIRDDCELTVRGLIQSKPLVRVILDSRLRTPPHAKIFNDADNNPVLIFFTEIASDAQKAEALNNIPGTELISCDPKKLTAVMTELSRRGISRLMVEGGATIHGQFLKEKLCDQLYLYRAPKILGGEAYELFSDFKINDIQSSSFFRLNKTLPLGEDMLEIYDFKE